jgi:hypothetical protein
MSDYEMTVNIFVHLLTTQSSLFSQEDRAELIQLIDEQSDEIQSLSNAISGWLSEHSEVDNALAEFESKVVEKSPGEKQANQDIPRYKLDKEHIINAIQQSSPSAKDGENTTRNN